MSLTKRAAFPELYELIDGVKANRDEHEAEHDEDHITEADYERAEAIRDGMREDGINV